METITIISFFIAPLFMIFLALMSHEIMEKADYKSYLGSYFLGMIAAIPMIVALIVAAHYEMVHPRSIRRILFFSFFLVGLFSEGSKYLMLRYYYLPKAVISKPMDGILYSVNIALGFATAANIYFSFQWTTLLNVYAVNYTLPFANLLLGIIMGFFVGMAKFRTNFIDSLTGLAAALFFQGFYNFCLVSKDYVLLGLVSLGTLIIAILLIVKSINTDTDTLV